MTTPPTDPIQPWWTKPGGAPPPGAPAPRAPYPPPPQRPPPPPQPDPHHYRLPPQPPASHRVPNQASGPNMVLLGGIAGAVVLLIVAGVSIWAWKFRDSTVIDVAQAEAGVREILSDPINGYGSNTISAMRCNGGKNPAAAKGDSFTCEVEIDGAVRHVTVVFQDDKGTFAVDGPR
ncbi:DUF4333 domain-containing protein [Mycobacterium hackensackense]|uniref:DUF4333 domain-containing protein n=1 Tax=Mycobacterium hackensackense TaxID=228909 RepID=UPI002265C80A|nr:DUF4333 domain-containing protein [Mycobacterium hackensackense]MCV7255204.1 DUF4333 domain-containing protein [Mycobacterium hackensackense]